MAKHIVKCPKCGERFDTQVIQAVKVSARRYGHATCYPDLTDFIPLGPKADPDLQKLKDYIKKIFGDKARWPLINKQIKKYKEENNYSYSGMLKSLVYFYEIKGNSIEKSNYSIGIIPYCYQDSYNYYYSLYMAEEANKNKSLITQIKEIIIKPPKSKRPRYQFFDFKEWEGEE